MLAYSRGLDILGGSVVIGMFDIGNAQRNMNDLKPVTIEIARILLRGGQDAINGAINGAKQPWYKSDLPGETSRKEVAGKLQWHADNLTKFSASSPTMVYPSGDDLKKWVMQAYIEANAVEEGAAYLDDSWQKMWNEISSKLKAMPRAALSASGDVVETVTGVPVWAWALGGVGVVTLLGFAIYKLANSQTGATIAGVAARRYLP